MFIDTPRSSLNHPRKPLLINCLSLPSRLKPHSFNSFNIPTSLSLRIPSLSGCCWWTGGWISRPAAKSDRDWIQSSGYAEKIRADEINGNFVRFCVADNSSKSKGARSDATSAPQVKRAPPFWSNFRHETPALRRHSSWVGCCDASLIAHMQNSEVDSKSSVSTLYYFQIALSEPTKGTIRYQMK